MPVRLQLFLYPANFELDRMTSHTAVLRKVVLQSGEKLTQRCQKLLWVIGFYGCLSEPRGVSAWRKETAQTRVRASSSLVAKSP